jgi:hypothetical protein
MSISNGDTVKVLHQNGRFGETTASWVLSPIFINIIYCRSILAAKRIYVSGDKFIVCLYKFSRIIFYECTLFFCIDLKSGRYHKLIHCKGTGALNTENDFSSVRCSSSHIFGYMALSMSFHCSLLDWYLIWYGNKMVWGFLGVLSLMSVLPQQ